MHHYIMFLYVNVKVKGEWQDTMRFSRFTSDITTNSTQKNELPPQVEIERHDGYQWTALSVTTVGALLGAIQGSALLIALPNILAELHTTFFTIMHVVNSRCVTNLPNCKAYIRPNGMYCTKRYNLTCLTNPRY